MFVGVEPEPVHAADGPDPGTEGVCGGGDRGDREYPARRWWAGSGVDRNVCFDYSVSPQAIFSPYKDAIAFVILIGLLLMKPEGIFGKAVPEKVRR